MTQTARTITLRTKIGFGYSAFNDTPITEPSIIGTIRTIWDKIDADLTFVSLRSGGSYLRADYFLYDARARQWKPVTPAEMKAINEAVAEDLYKY